MICPYCNNDLWFCKCLLCTGCGKPTHLCICSKGKPERFPDPVRDLDPNLPPEIWEAARVLTQWADNHGHQFWQIKGVCDRRFAFFKESLDRAPVKPMPTYQPKPEPAKPELEGPKCFRCGEDPAFCDCDDSCVNCGQELKKCPCLSEKKPEPDPKAPSPGPIEAALGLSSPSGLPSRISVLFRGTIRVYRVEEGK